MHAHTVNKWVGYWESFDDDGELLSTGSCWPVSEDLVITNYHVIAGGPRARATFRDFGKFPVMGIVAYDKKRDLAIAQLRVGKQALCPLAMDESLPVAGSDIYVYGNPQGLTNTISRGIISSVRTGADFARIGINSIDVDDYLLQIDASISHGSSGGPIVDLSGNVVGIVSFAFAKGNALNFAVPSIYAAQLLDMQENLVPLKNFQQTKQSQVSQVSNSAIDTFPEEDVNITKISCVIQLLLAAVIADGSYDKMEMHVFLDILKELGIPMEDQNTQIFIKANMDLVNKSIEEKGWDSFLEDILDILNVTLDRNMKLKILGCLARIHVADGVIDSGEEHMIDKLKEIWC